MEQQWVNDDEFSFLGEPLNMSMVILQLKKYCYHCYLLFFTIFLWIIFMNNITNHHLNHNCDFYQKKKYQNLMFFQNCAALFKACSTLAVQS